MVERIEVSVEEVITHRYTVTAIYAEGTPGVRGPRVLQSAVLPTKQDALSRGKAAAGNYAQQYIRAGKGPARVVEVGQAIDVTA